jgi:Na+-transporting NADH:ubiquinone oxidoreductase subunit C
VPKTDSTRYTFLFAAAVCVVCALLVAASAVGLRDRQENNQLVYRQKNVLLAAGLVKPDQKLSDRELQAIFDKNIVVRLIDLKTGEMIPEGKIDARSFDQKKARNDPAQSRAAPPNPALVSRLPNYGAVYFVTKGVKDAPPELVVLPIEGMAMWATVYGFIAVERDGNTVRGLTFYDQQETPGLGGEIGNPKWQALWQGRKAFDANWEPQLKVIKGQAGPPDKDPHRIDGLSGATITSNGISRVIAFWFSKDGYAPYLKQLREGAKS